jgi:hypothetical protein
MTLRGLFVLVAILAVCCAALKFAGVWASVFFGIALLIVVGIAIVAFVDRGSRQAYAIGFTLAAFSYAATVLVTHTGFGGGELSPYSCSLPTTKVLAPAFRLIVHQTWIDSGTGKEVPNYVPPKSGGSILTGGGGSLAGVGGFMNLHEFPDQRTFMAVGHVLWALVVGCIGGYFGRLTYARRQMNGASPIKRETQSQ